MIVDKEELNKHVEKLVEEMKNGDVVHSEKVKELENKHLKETKKMKEIWIMEEKVKREKWENDKTKSIKEMTIKGIIIL